MKVSKARDLHVRGIVQGVGFRPFVYRAAHRFHLSGWVLNAADGVHIHIEGNADDMDAFSYMLKREHPVAAAIHNIHTHEALVEGFTQFLIRESEAGTAEKTLVSADIATCKECLVELFDGSDRRFHYPFINCTNCGPRFTIIEDLPYDRKDTSMKNFSLCDACAEEYEKPTDRRFHAQPNACFDCGPHLSLYKSGASCLNGTTREESEEIITQTAALFRAGKIMAIKGLGGYHLACDARNENAVFCLRSRKHRYGKPLAIMVRDVATARRYCHINETEEQLLTGSVRPIILLERRGMSTSSFLAPSVVGTLHELGVMLPYTPLQHLLMHELDFPIVMTSGNLSEEPILSDNTVAHKLLGTIADAFLDNDRAITSRYDDSVLRVIGDTKIQCIRRARGYAPVPINFPKFESPQPIDSTEPSTGEVPSILAVGPEQKSTFTLTRGTQAFTSQHIGDLENAETFVTWKETIHLYEQLFGLTPSVISHDLHPEYLSTKWALDNSRELLLPCVGVQHHHAHIASVLAENNCPPETPVIGFAFDGTGYGLDKTLWGGEVLIATFADFRRFARLSPVPLIGGAAGIKHPARMAYALLKHEGLDAHTGADQLRARLGNAHITLMEQMLNGNINTPLTSSSGRLFDAVAALLGLCDDAPYDGGAPALLEAKIYNQDSGTPVNLPETPHPHFELTISSREDISYEITSRPVLIYLLNGLAENMDISVLARMFHEAFISMLFDCACKAREKTGINTVALSGGSFMNRYIITRIIPLLEQNGFTLLLNDQLPPNDGCISYGQAAVAAARLR